MPICEAARASKISSTTCAICVRREREFKWECACIHSLEIDIKMRVVKRRLESKKVRSVLRLAACLYLSVVVACAQGAELRKASLFGSR